MRIPSLTKKSKAWTAPHFDGPWQIDDTRLTPIGDDHRGRHWFASEWGELRERAALVPEHDLPDGPVVLADVEGDVKMYRVFEPAQPPGTFATLSAPVAPKPKAAKPFKPVDALAGLVFGLGADVSAKVTALRKRGLLVRWAGRIEAVADHADLTRDAAFLAALPLLEAHLSGRPLSCQVSPHAKPVPATTLALPAIPWCGRCDFAAAEEK